LLATPGHSRRARGDSNPRFIASIAGRRHRVSENVYPLSKRSGAWFESVAELRSRVDLDGLQRLEERDQRAAVLI